MLNLIIADLYKLSKSTAVKVCFVVSLACAIGLAIVSHSLATGTLSEAVKGNAAGLGDVMIVFLLGSLLLGIEVGSDFETKLIHDEVACGGGRRSIVVSKTVVFVFLVAFIVLPYAVVSIICFGTGMEFAKPFIISTFLDMMQNSMGYAVTATVIGKMILVSLITMLVYAARLSICLPLAFKVRKPLIIMAVSFIAGFFIDLFIGVTADIAILGDVLSYTPFAMGGNVVTATAGAGTLVKAVLASVVFLALMAILSYRVFRKAEIK